MDNETQEAATYPTERIFNLDLSRQGDFIRASCCENSGNGCGTLKKYEEEETSLPKAEKYSARIKELLARANRRGKLGNDMLAGLKQTGQLLYEELIPVQIKKEINKTALKHLVLGLDDGLVHIPWELCHDGEQFFCQRFNMGRVVATKQQFAALHREIKNPLSILLLADPQGNLPASHREGIELREMLDQTAIIAEATFKSSNVNKDYLKGKLRDFDILHYAGHAEYDSGNPEDSGFLFSDAKLTSREILNMAGKKPFPSLVFSNACDSGRTIEWSIAEGYENVFGLANAFLLSGVRHYLGAFQEIPDEPSLHFALAFYKELLSGKMIGEAVRLARLALMEAYGENAIFWAGYMLYGDPTIKYIQPRVSAKEPVGVMKAPKELNVGELRGPTPKNAAPKGPRRKTLIFAVVSTFFAAAAFLIYLNSTKQNVASQAPGYFSDVAAARTTDGAGKINALIRELSEYYKERKEIPALKVMDDWPSKNISIVFLSIDAHGAAEAEKDFLIAGLAENLQASKRIRIVERQILDKLLGELKLSSSELADSAEALKIGKILSARLMAAGSIAKDNDEWMISLRFIETETTAVGATISIVVKERDIAAAAKTLGKAVAAKLKSVYPLKARIESVDGDAVFINIGADLGMEKGLRMEALTDDGQVAAELVAASVEDSITIARAEKSGKPAAGMRVREIPAPDSPQPQK